MDEPIKIGGKVIGRRFGSGRHGTREVLGAYIGNPEPEDEYGRRYLVKDTHGTIHRCLSIKRFI